MFRSAGANEDSGSVDAVVRPLTMNCFEGGRTDADGVLLLSLPVTKQIIVISSTLVPTYWEEVAPMPSSIVGTSSECVPFYLNQFSKEVRLVPKDDKESPEGLRLSKERRDKRRAMPMKDWDERFYKQVRSNLRLADAKLSKEEIENQIKNFRTNARYRRSIHEQYYNVCEGDIYRYIDRYGISISSFRKKRTKEKEEEKRRHEMTTP